MDLLSVDGLYPPICNALSWNYNRKKQKDTSIENDQNEDHNNIALRLYIVSILKTIDMALLILNLSFISGIMWYIICDVSSTKYKEWMDEFKIDPDVVNSENFFDTNHFNHRSNTNIMVLLTYYAFTSLSSVGFGDISPRSDVERLFCMFMFFLAGVTVFSIIMGNFIEILS
jgi:hypothetical protein